MKHHSIVPIEIAISAAGRNRQQTARTISGHSLFLGRVSGGEKKMTTRLCPVCSQQPLESHTFRGVQIDVCPVCAGIWFDAGEVKLLLKQNSNGGLICLAKIII